ncbi:MAG TPA: lactate utilization protein [Rhodocyclaceae bacterium]|nr:lactate utilization protein [Rhodocyclaceae bacterium]
MSARDAILAKLKASPPAETPAAPDVGAWYAAHRPTLSAAEALQQFRRCIEAAHAEVHLVAEDWPEQLRAVLRARQISQLLLAPATPHGQQAQTALAGEIVCRGYEQPIEAWKSELFTVTPAAFTRARSAIAETGTLILWPTPDEPRTMSLVPPLHIVLLDAATLHPTFHAAMLAEGWRDGLPTNALLISGPSKTADIQQTLAYGAHGPKELVVLIQGAQA